MSTSKINLNAPSLDGIATFTVLTLSSLKVGMSQKFELRHTYRKQYHFPTGKDTRVLSGYLGFIGCKVNVLN